MYGCNGLCELLGACDIPGYRSDKLEQLPPQAFPCRFTAEGSVYCEAGCQSC